MKLSGPVRATPFVSTLHGTGYACRWCKSEMDYIPTTIGDEEDGAIIGLLFWLFCPICDDLPEHRRYKRKNA